MHHKAIPQPCSGYELSESARQDIQSQDAVLSVVLDQLPCLLTVAELVREIPSDNRDTVERAVTDLVAAGLLRSEGDSVLPTRTAMHSALLVAVAQ
jgi:hypothetical protein